MAGLVEELIRREPCGRPHHADEYLADISSRSNIEFCHPAYDDKSCVLFCVPGHDSLGHGLHHETARLICFVIADNRDGWFTSERDGERIETPVDGLLRLSRYYFRVSNNHTEKYPIVPTFTHWTFPHGKIPEYWKGCTNFMKTSPLAACTTLRGRENTCRLSNYSEQTEQARLIPRSQEHWFFQNMMGKYSKASRPDDNLINSISNMILLRSDIYGLFDQQRITFLPKPSRDPNQSSMVAHVLSSGPSTELVNLYHNVPLQQLNGIPLEYLFTRFAWSVLPLLAPFLRQGTPRSLSVVEETGKKTKDYDGAACWMFSTLNRTRSESPKKRKLGQTGEQCECGDGSSESDSSEASRGRKRRRSISFSWPSGLGSSSEVEDLAFASIKSLEVEKTIKIQEGYGGEVD